MLKHMHLLFYLVLSFSTGKALPHFTVDDNDLQVPCDIVTCETPFVHQQKFPSSPNALFKRSDEVRDGTTPPKPPKPDLRRVNPRLGKLARDAKRLDGVSQQEKKKSLMEIRREAMDIYSTAIADEIRCLLAQPKLSIQQITQKFDDFEKRLSWDSSLDSLSLTPVELALRPQCYSTPSEIKRIRVRLYGSEVQKAAMRKAKEANLHPLEGVKDFIATHGLAALKSYRLRRAYPNMKDAKKGLDSNGLVRQLRSYARVINESFKAVARGE